MRTELQPAQELVRVVDAASVVHDTPVGRLRLEASPHGLTRLSFDDAAPPLANAARAMGLLDEARHQLDEYFSARRQTFEVALDLREVNPFRRRIVEAACTIAFGTTITYGELARRAGNAPAVRAGGTALGKNPVPIFIPCHRVVRAGGVIGSYSGGADKKSLLLELERTA